MTSQSLKHISLTERPKSPSCAVQVCPELQAWSPGALRTAALSHRCVSSNCEQQFPLGWVSQLELPRPGSLWGCRCVQDVAAKKAVGRTGARNHIQCGVGERLRYTQISLSYSLWGRGEIFIGNVLGLSGKEFFGNTSIQSAVKRGVPEANSRLKGVRVSSLSS